MYPPHSLASASLLFPVDYSLAAQILSERGARQCRRLRSCVPNGFLFHFAYGFHTALFLGDLALVWDVPEGTVDTPWQGSGSPEGTKAAVALWPPLSRHGVSAVCSGVPLWPQSLKGVPQAAPPSRNALILFLTQFSARAPSASLNCCGFDAQRVCPHRTGQLLATSLRGQPLWPVAPVTPCKQGKISRATVRKGPAWEGKGFKKVSLCWAFALATGRAEGLVWCYCRHLPCSCCGESLSSLCW